LRTIKCKVGGREIDIVKPQFLNVYTASMGGVDHADQLRPFYYVEGSLESGTSTYSDFHLI